MSNDEKKWYLLMQCLNELNLINELQIIEDILLDDILLKKLNVKKIDKNNFMMRV